MASITLNTATSSALLGLLGADDIVPGAEPSYQLCKTIYSYHPLGLKLVDFPILMAQSKPREITVPKGPEECLVEAFKQTWKRLECDKILRNLKRMSRIYGIASLALLTKDEGTETPVNFETLWKSEIGFNVLDPLNTSGSLVLNQDPNSIDFLKTSGISVQGKGYHRSRTCTQLNEEPIYLDYTTSAFGYVGRSIFQRALFPLKTYVSSMMTDDLVVLKSGVLIAKLVQQSSAIDEMMRKIGGQKRSMIQEAQTNNVISIGDTEAIESLDLRNLEGPYALARKNCIDNIASSAGTPAKIIQSETFAEGFGEGTEDAKHVAQYIDTIREDMGHSYDFMSRIVRAIAWNPDYYVTIQNQFPDEYGGMEYTQAFVQWSNSFTATWPSLLEEPESEQVTVAETRLKSVIALVEVFAPQIDPQNKVRVLQWAADNFNALKTMFTSPLELDYDALVAYLEEEKAKAEDAAKAMQEGAGEGEESGIDKVPPPPGPFAG